MSLLVALYITFTGEVFGQMNPKYVALVGGIGSGYIKRGQFLAEQGVMGMRKISAHHWEPIPVDSFTLMILRDTSTLHLYRNVGNHFEPSLKLLLKGLKINDNILIFNIHARDYGNKKVYLSPLEYKIE